MSNLEFLQLELAVGDSVGCLVSVAHLRAAVVEIERLEAENVRLREALKPLAQAEWYSMICCGHKAIGIFAEDIERAKKALS